MIRTLAENKSDLVAAHMAEDWDSAATLSQERQRLKKKRTCVDCGSRIRTGFRCQIHARARRYYANSIPELT